MQLSTQLFDRIVGISSSREQDRRGTVLPAGCRKAPERRQATRIAFGQRTLICRDSGPTAGVWETVMLQDISQRGVGFLSDEPLPAGETFMLKLTDKEGESIRIRCEIKRCERGGFGGTAFMVGAEFQQVIANQPLRVTNEDGEESPTAEAAASQAAAAAVQAMPQPAGLRSAGAAVARAAASFLRAVDPSQWMRKEDDFSSVG